VWAAPGAHRFGSQACGGNRPLRHANSRPAFEQRRRQAFSYRSGSPRTPHRGSGFRGGKAKPRGTSSGGHKCCDAVVTETPPDERDRGRAGMTQLSPAAPAPSFPCACTDSSTLARSNPTAFDEHQQAPRSLGVCWTSEFDRGPLLRRKGAAARSCILSPERASHEHRRSIAHPSDRAASRRPA
jgi:hypothetical protein